MEIRADQWEALTLLHAAQHDQAGDGWVTEDSGIEAATVRALAQRGLCHMAEPAMLDTRNSGPCPQWAAQIAPDGCDALLYRQARQDHSESPPPQWLAKQSDPTYQEVSLQRAEMTLLRTYVRITPHLRQSPANGLNETVLEAHWDTTSNRWLLQVTTEQMTSIAHAFYLERLAGAARAANRFGREYGIKYAPNIVT